jgi:hypothetical protein
MIMSEPLYWPTAPRFFGKADDLIVSSPAHDAATRGAP